MSNKPPRNPQRQPRKNDWCWVASHLGRIARVERVPAVNVQPGGKKTMQVLYVELMMNVKVPYYDQERFRSEQFRLPKELKNTKAKTVEVVFFPDELIILPANPLDYPDMYQNDLRFRGLNPTGIECIRHINNALFIYSLIAKITAASKPKPKPANA